MDRLRLNEELREMRRLIRSDPEMLARFDRDGNGSLDGEEWERVRQQVVRELARQLDETQPPRGVAREVFDAERAAGLCGGASPVPRGVLPAVAGKVLAPVLLAGLLYMVGLATFWGGFLFILTAELIRWCVVGVYPAHPDFKPLVELMGIALAPLLSLLILIWLPGPFFDGEVRDDLIGAAMLYICYLPYAFASVMIFPAFRPTR